MKNNIFSGVLLTSLLITGSVQANLFGLKQVATPASTTNSAMSQLAALRSQSSLNSDFSPIEVHMLKNADCTDLAVYTANAKREMKTLLDNADQYDAQQEAVVEQKKSGGFMSGLMTVANLAGKAAALATGDLELMQLTSSISQVTNTLSAVNNTKNALAQQAAVPTNAVSEADAGYILKRYKKHEADLENIKIYQSAKACH